MADESGAIAVPGPIAAPLRAQVLRDEHQHAGPLHTAVVVLAGQQDTALDGPKPNNHHRARRQHRNCFNSNLVSLWDEDDSGRKSFDSSTLTDSIRCFIH